PSPSIRPGPDRPASRRAGPSSGLSADDQVREITQSLRTRAEGFECGVRLLQFGFGHALRFGQAVDGGKGDLLLLGILASGLAEGFRRLFDVEYIVEHLEWQPDVLAVRGESGELRGGGAC